MFLVDRSGGVLATWHANLSWPPPCRLFMQCVIERYVEESPPQFSGLYGSLVPMKGPGVPSHRVFLLCGNQT